MSRENKNGSGARKTKIVWAQWKQKSFRRKENDNGLRATVIKNGLCARKIKIVCVQWNQKYFGHKENENGLGARRMNMIWAQGEWNWFGHLVYVLTFVDVWFILMKCAFRDVESNNNRMIYILSSCNGSVHGFPKTWRIDIIMCVLINGRAVRSHISPLFEVTEHPVYSMY